MPKTIDIQKLINNFKNKMTVQNSPPDRVYKKVSGRFYPVPKSYKGTKYIRIKVREGKYIFKEWKVYSKNFKNTNKRNFGKKKVSNKEKQKLINNFKKVNKNFKEEQYKLSVFNLLLGSGLVVTAVLIFLVFFVKNPEDDNNLDDNNLDDSLISFYKKEKKKEKEKNFKKSLSQNESGIGCKKDGCINEGNNIYNSETGEYDINMKEFNKVVSKVDGLNYDRIAIIKILENNHELKKKYHKLLRQLKDPKKPFLTNKMTWLKKIINEMNLEEMEKDKSIGNYKTQKTNLRKSNTKQGSRTTPGEVFDSNISKNQTLKNTSKRHDLKELKKISEQNV